MIEFLKKHVKECKLVDYSGHSTEKGSYSGELPFGPRIKIKGIILKIINGILASSFWAQNQD